MTNGVWLGVDVGRARVGVARTDPAGIMALPVKTLTRCRWGSDVDEFAQLVRQLRAECVVVGLPVHMSGRAGNSAADALAWARALDELLDGSVPIRLVDERLTTVTAHQHLCAAGRAAKTHRSVVDQQAAVVILNQALQIATNTGGPCGIDLNSYSTKEDAAGE